jgi:hypothetical protein
MTVVARLPLSVPGAGTPLCSGAKGAQEVLALIAVLGLVTALAQCAAPIGRVDRNRMRGVAAQTGAVHDAIAHMAGSTGDALVSKGRVKLGIVDPPGSLHIAVVKAHGPLCLLGHQRGVAVDTDPPILRLADLGLKLRVYPRLRVGRSPPLGSDLGVA